MMTRFNIGDEIRISGHGAGGLSIGTIAKVVEVDSDGDVWLDNGAFYLTENIEHVKPPGLKKSARITALETQVAALEAKVEALEANRVVVPSGYPLTERFERESAVESEAVDAILADIKRKAKPTLDALLATYPTANEQRSDVIKRAKEFVGEGFDRWYGTKLHTVEFHVNNDKRTVVALLRWKIDNSVVYKGIAKCDPDDVFNADIGKAIALARALGVEVPTEFVKAVQPTEVVVGQYVDSLTYPGEAEQVVSVTSDKVYVKYECFWRVGALNDSYRITDDTDAVYE